VKDARLEEKKYWAINRIKEKKNELSRGSFHNVIPIRFNANKALTAF
jgi:hypothetical protein